MPNEVFDHGDFQSELANFLSPPNLVYCNLPPPPAHPQHITTLSGLLRSVGRSTDVPRVTKHVRDHVGRLKSEYEVPWRRSSLWLLIRVAIQMSADRSPLGRAAYKRFMLFFMCTLSRDRSNADLSSDLLHLMSSKVLRWLSRLGSSPPRWLSEVVLKTCACLGEILDARWKQLSARPSPFRNPSQEELTRDTRLSLLNIREYIRNAVANPVQESFPTPFHPDHRCRGTLEDFLSSNGSFFKEACRVSRDVTLYDVERSVEQGIDDWLACVTNVNEACVQLGLLLDEYLNVNERNANPEDEPIKLLTLIELCLALDKLVVKEIPMLADYSPEIPIALLEGLLLRKMTSLHRLSCAYRYLFIRHSQSRPGWSVLSDHFTEDSFPVRYYDQSPHLQQLKVRIEKAALKDVGRGGLQCESASIALSGRQLVDGAGGSGSPLPDIPSQAKAVIFELQCPVYVHVWRSAITRILQYVDPVLQYFDPESRETPIADVPELQPYFVGYQGPPLSVEFHLTYLYRWDNSLSRLRYTPQPTGSVRQDLRFGKQSKYVGSTSHTPNNVLAAQVDCPVDLALDEFITFAHLRSGGSLQWLNILLGLRSRTLNLRREQVHDLLTHAAFQVGPLDSNTGAWIWHQELQDSCFCNALLDELDSLFVDIGARSIDAVLMGNIALLLTRVLASNPGEDVSERATALLRSVCKRTFAWVQELSYDLAMAPTNKQRSHLLVDMAATCRSTFDVDPATLFKHVYSAEDVDALLSCAFFIHALRDGYTPPALINFNFSAYVEYSRLLLPRDRRLSFSLEEILRDEILADPSDYGVDLAVAKFFVGHKPCPYRWEQLQRSNARWLVCQTAATMDYPSQSVHINLLNGEFRVASRPCNTLPHDITTRLSPEYKSIFCDQGFFLVPSNLSGMDFAVFSMGSEHKVHFSLQNDNLVVRAQCRQMNDILQLIPPSKLRGDLPSSLVNDHVHWLNLSTSTIEIRPLKKLWEESSENWKIDCTPGRYRMYKGHETLVDIRSPTWAVVSKYLANFCKCLDSPLPIDEQRGFCDILITTSTIDSVPQLSVAFPRYDLSFFVNARDELESRDFKDMVYDEDQSIGTLFSIENLLVLRPKSHLVGCLLPEALIPRRVLIPNGEFLKRNDGGQLSRNPHLHGTSGPLYYTYEVDTELGCLTGNGELKSTRYLAYLHAMTSCYRPDPLTGKTGAQAGLSLLQSARCRSIMRLESLPDDESDMDVNTVKFWSSTTEYPQINIAYSEIQRRYYWSGGALDDLDDLAVGRASHLFPWNATAATTSESPEDPDSTQRLPERSQFGLDSEDIVSTTAASNTLPGLPHLVSSLQYTSSECAQWPIMLDQLLSDRPAPELPPRHTPLPTSHKTSSPGDIPELNRLFSHLQIKQTDPPFKERYLTLLGTSAGVSKEFPHFHIVVAGKDRIDTLRRHYAQCRIKYTKALGKIKETLGPTTGREQALHQFGQWPPIMAGVLLQCLASTSKIKLPIEWKKCITSLALLLLDLQRARRLLRFALDGFEEEFSQELENKGCDGWNAEENPDWLLIQVQGNFLIRRNQAEIAIEMMSPRSGKNTVMQVNMGEGKTSVIIPIVAATLADGEQLVRVIAPKALTIQMFELLVARLGGFTNRPIYHLPFSRINDWGSISRRIDDLHHFISQCMAERGILLVRPEDVVSLKLMSVEEQIHKGKLVADPFPKLCQTLYKQVTTTLSLASIPETSVVGGLFQWLSQSLNHPRTKDAAQHIEDPRNAFDSAPMWVSLQKWIHSHVRDIVDESDETFHPRFQLIYTIGHEQHMDGYPDRWTITQQVLGLVKHHVYTISRNHPDSVEYECGPPGSFPHVRIVRASNVGRRLISSIVDDVMDGRLPNFDFLHVSTALHDAIRSFISNPVPDTAKDVEEYAKGSDQNHLWNGLLLLRGLLASNMLLFSLAERRWRVDYGLVSHDEDDYPFERTPTMLAVPYRAKDVPGPNTQFGHPDLTIILTCLSYYYGGLSEKQLRIAFEILLDQDDPSMGYALWVKEYDSELLSDSLRKPSEINLKSSEKWDNIVYPHFSRNKAAIDLYLSRVVFPMEAKGFLYKLSGSSWDLAEKREKLVTGFSGTNDSRWLLPMSITQQDLDHQRGTNARVLAYLLRPENDFYIVTHENGKRKTTLEFLQLVTMQQPEIRVVLDVGAQILDFSNRQVAKEWLDIAHTADGVIYFNENHELVVLTRNGITQPMSWSPLSRQLDRCIVYLDHAHTRGTDIKLPIESRAAVTLGPKVTKDALVQGCMRMRKLGCDLSVMFFAPLEVDQTIRAVAGKKDPNTRVTTVDILCWAINETWTDIEQRAPYWAQQGMNHTLRYDAWSRFCNNELGPEQLSAVWLEPELKSLVDLYAPCETKDAQKELSTLNPGIRQRCKDLGIVSLPGVQLEEEQEREREREVELPPKARPAEHHLHQDVVAFVKTGVIPPLHSGSAFLPLFTSLERSSAATRDSDVWSPLILATADFCKTIDPESTRGTIDQYLRPVQWILSRRKGRGQLLVLLSPFEADRLMPDIRTSEYVHLHVYAPRTSQGMKPSDDLRLYSIPPLPSDWTPPWDLIDQLNVFAGQLYLRDYTSYLRLCRFLGVSTSVPNDSVIRRNLFKIPGSFEEMEITFSGSPLPSVMTLLLIRNRGRPFAQTHMGKILQGQSLEEKDFEVPTSAMSDRNPATCGRQTTHDVTPETVDLSSED